MIEFYNCSLKITKDVLIPRQETEILVDKICTRLKQGDLKDKIAWDLCTGSGCIGIAIKRKFPELKVILSDISEEALRVAHQNAPDIEKVQGDLLEPFRGQIADFIFCNPPYITDAEYPTLDASVRDFEPKIALVGGPTGLEFYARLSRELPFFLKPKAKVFFEIGYNQGEAVKKLFSDPFWTYKVVEKDWAGHDRFFFLETE